MRSLLKKYGQTKIPIISAFMLIVLLRLFDNVRIFSKIVVAAVIVVVGGVVVVVNKSSLSFVFKIDNFVF